MRKRKWIVAAVTFLIIAAFILPQGAVGFHCVLAKTPEHLTLQPLEAWQFLQTEKRALELYGLFAALVALVLLIFVLTGSGVKYSSSMQRITPDIYTPYPEGQGQFGTARWMDKRKIRKHFAVWKRKKNGWFQELMQAGKAMHKEVKAANVKLD